MHLALLGDSVFDNRAYTRGEPDVVGHLRAILTSTCRVTLCAVDGSSASDIARQLTTVPADVSRLVISVGGNDALLNSDLLGTSVASTAEALALFAERVERFERDYRDAALARCPEVTTCTIYNGNLDPDEAPLARVALMIFNDVILRVAFGHALDVLDLRLVCTEPADYANPIEPSGRGGRKIAEAIARSVTAGDRRVRATRVFVG